MKIYAFKCALPEYLVRNLIHLFVLIEVSMEINE